MSESFSSPTGKLLCALLAKWHFVPNYCDPFSLICQDIMYICPYDFFAPNYCDHNSACLPVYCVHMPARGFMYIKRPVDLNTNYWLLGTFMVNLSYVPNQNDLGCL